MCDSQAKNERKGSGRIESIREAAQAARSGARPNQAPALFDQETHSLSLRDAWIGDAEALRRELAAWQEARNASKSVVKWRFKVDDAGIKLHRLYPQM